MMVSELASEGSLLTYLRGQREAADALPSTQVGTFAVQIAVRAASRSLPPKRGGQFDFVRSSARTPHADPQYV